MQQKDDSLFVDFPKFTINVLNGNSIAVMVAVLPDAFIGQILRLFGVNIGTANISMMTAATQSLFPVFAAFAVAYFVGLGILEGASLATAAFASAGVVSLTSQGLVIAGTGSILNVMFVTYFGALFAIWIKDHLGQFKTVTLPSIMLLMVGGFGLATLPFMLFIQNFIGAVVDISTSYTPIFMGIVLGIAFAIIITSPISSVGVATAIGLSGVGSGASSLGIAGAALTLALMGAKVNPWGGTLAIFIGSPKLQMTNLLIQPRLYAPIILSAGIMGGVGAFLGITGTVHSAGFGTAGLVGPLTAFDVTPGVGGVMRIIMAYVPILTGVAMFSKWLFMDKLKWISDQDLSLPNI
ncbi:MAG: PTS sugar transporter subunit IIC [Lactobacillaceae bacterium]|jgi:uncharacterized membrane protein|nr:PTS sugar transporter subunit IIC [Lactobacillaceae bacterium]